MSKLRVFLFRALVVCAALLPRGTGAAEYKFPIQDPYLATVLGTPADLRAPIPDHPVARDHAIVLFEDREIPGAFWPHTRFRYSVARQEGAAPLIFLVAGTGALYNSAKLRYLQAVFYQAGFHVVNLTSPSHVEFIVTASRSSAPGNMPADVHDLYAAMERIWEDLRGDMLVTEFHLAGYSLGASESAFLAELDSRHQRFRFQKVMLINPSVELLTSVTNLDQMLADAIPGGAQELKAVFQDLFRRVAKYLRKHGRDPLDTELLYKIAEVESVTKEELKTLISVSFRISSANMLFASDVMTGARHLAEPADLGITTPLGDYLKVAGRWTWVDYLDDMLLPFWRQSEPDLTREALVERDSLHSIEGFLSQAKHVGVMTNRDDLILGPGDIAWLERTFGDRATIYPTGGHCGNLMYRENVEHMLAFFGAGSGSGE